MRKHASTHCLRMADGQESLMETDRQRWASRCTSCRRYKRSDAGRDSLDVLVNAVGKDHPHTLLQPTELLLPASQSL